MTKKVCIKCQIEKESPQDFYMTKDYERSTCRDCFKKITKKQSQERKEKQKLTDPENSYSKRYYLKNKEKFAEYRKRFLEKHPGYMKRYYKKSEKTK